ncbi:E3 ubiquitin-protein ligase APD3-like [Impatiens glandulifera]|uniref:E3 ubiquitin-protein ligase APD3-like n=1 Tax=Impatiens glandulifera TaxID=253017 RepID=UPI001FB08D47|nr:E3 ubiquitin-protein ligase APD3-like [Impatiens glandulifera]
MKPTSPVFNATHLYESTRHGMKSEYCIEEDDIYYVTIANLNTINTISTTISINVASKMYDITKADRTCDSSSSGSCRFHLGFAFPTNKFFVLVSPSPYDGGDDDDGWYVELSFIARLVTYIAILGFVVIVALLILRYFGACNLETDEENYNVHTTSASVSTEVDPLIPDKTYRVPYGTRVEDEDDDEGSSSSGEDLYDGKICVICYDMMRNCFFVPCGHCATCHNCALRIMEGETRVCPICRRLIHKVRKLLIP